MTRHLLGSTLVGLALALAAAPSTPAPSTPAPSTLAPGTPPAGGSSPVPCPIVEVAPQPPAPTPSPVPTHDPTLPVIGGELLDTPGLVVPAGAPRLPGNLSARSWVVADLDTGAVLGACGPHEYHAPASLQKLLLAATLLAKLDPDEVITVTREDLGFEPGSSAVGLLLGGRYSVRTLWLGLLLNSGNDAANTLARIGGGELGVPGTLAAMNAEARRLGALDTHAETPHGLDGPGQVTSAYDMALIARACFIRADFREYAATRTTQMPAVPPRDPDGFQIQNDNRLLRNYPGALGGKTGFTDIARHNFVGAAQRDGRRLVVALLFAEHRPVRTWQQAAALLDWGFATPAGASVGRLVEPGEAERLLAEAAARARAQRSATPPDLGQASVTRSTVTVGGVVGAAVLGSVLLGLLLARRRRATGR